PAPRAVRETPTPTAWSPSSPGTDSASRLRRASMTARALIKSPTAQRSSPSLTSPGASMPQLPNQSVQADGMRDRLPSGSTTNNNGTPRRLSPLITARRHPWKGWRLRVITTEVGTSWEWVVCGVFVRQCPARSAVGESRSTRGRCGRDAPAEDHAQSRREARRSARRGDFAAAQQHLPHRGRQDAGAGEGGFACRQVHLRRICEIRGRPGDLDRRLQATRLADGGGGKTTARGTRRATSRNQRGEESDRGPRPRRKLRLSGVRLPSGAQFKGRVACSLHAQAQEADGAVAEVKDMFGRNQSQPVGRVVKL